tara:strand:- start:419 stop:1000 length:582 start_codon:yes stop_codon:yes gene_type:complete
MAIDIPPGAFKGVRSFGAGAPDAGVYAVSIVKIEANPNDKQGKRRFHLQFENGFTMFTFVNVPYENGQSIAGLSENQVRGQLANLRTILESLGYDGSTLDSGNVTDEWFLHASNHGRQGYVDFVPGQKGVTGSYNEIKGWLNKSAYEALKDSGAPAQAATTSAPVPSAASNGVAPSAGAVLPPPPSVAQGIVS